MKLFGVGMIRNFTDDAHDIAAEWGHAFALRLLDHARGRTTAFQEQTGHLYNLEATPAEGTTYRFAKEDRKRFPGILQAGTEHEPITPTPASFRSGLPATRSRPWNGRRRCSTKYTGGTVLHLYMGTQLSSAGFCRNTGARRSRPVHLRD